MANIGDCLNEPLCEWITGHPLNKKKVVGCGTILRVVNGHEVWGTGYDGFRDLGSKNKPPSKIHAVRGPKTREACLSWGWKCPEVYGDPGILLPRFVKPERNVIHEIGWVPHFKDELQELNGWFKVSPKTDDPWKFISELLMCEVIVSQSLHGLVLADAYGIPSVWAELSARPKWKNPVGFPKKGPVKREDAWTFKYEDYYTSIDVDPVCSMNPNDAKLHPIPDTMGDKLLEVCPW